MGTHQQATKLRGVMMTINKLLGGLERYRELKARGEWVKKEKKLTITRAVRLKCLECSNQTKSEVEKCPCTNCPLYTFRSAKAVKEAKQKGA